MPRGRSWVISPPTSTHAHARTHIRRKTFFWLCTTRKETTKPSLTPPPPTPHPPAWVIYALYVPLKETYQREMDTLNPLFVIGPCALMAIVAHPSTRHFIIFRVRVDVGGWRAERWQGREGGCPSASLCLGQGIHVSLLIHMHPNPPHTTTTTTADHVGLLCLPRGRLRAAPAAHDAESKGGREVHSPLRLCAGAVALHILRALDPAGGCGCA